MSLETSRPQRQIGSYDLIAKVAEGGMGAVYKARNQATGELVAIKIIPSDTARNPLLLKRFEQEFKAASLIDHPNVVKALDYCGAGPNPFLVMEFVEGESLGQKVERDGPLPEAEAVRLIGQVCEGLHRAHKQGLIHRDVKPDNVMVTPEGVAKLTDLGLVKDVEGEQLNLTRTGRGLGTPHFMAPEQFRNAKNADVRCDVYSLGATLYMLVTGEIPFNKTSPLECWMRKTKNDFPEPRALAPSLSDRVNWAIRRAMSAKPDQRPASCREFMEDLTGAGWRANGGSSATGTASTVRRAATEDLWYMVYRDAGGRLHTVKGSTDGIRKNVASGTLGDVATILVSRTKAGQFVPLRQAPEFRDLVIGPAPAGDLPAPSFSSSNRLSSTTFDPPSGARTPTGGRPGGGSSARIAAVDGPSVPRLAARTTPDAPVGDTTPPNPSPVSDITDYQSPLTAGLPPELPRPEAAVAEARASGGSTRVLWALVVFAAVATGLALALAFKFLK